MAVTTRVHNIKLNIKAQTGELTKVNNKLTNLEKHILSTNKKIRDIATAKTAAKTGMFDLDVAMSKKLKGNISELISEYNRLDTAIKKASSRERPALNREMRTVSGKIDREYSKAINLQKNALDNATKSEKRYQSAVKAKSLALKEATTAIKVQNTAYIKQRSAVIFALKQQKRQEMQNKTLGASFARLKEKIKGTTTAQRAMGASHTNISNDIIRHIRRVESLAVAYYGLTRAYGATLGAGIAFNKEMEEAQITIASIVASTSQNIAVDSGGSKRAVEEAEKWKIALAEADRYKKQIVQLNPETPLDLKDTTKIFQILLPQMRQYNATDKEKLELTKLLSIATKTGNLSMMEMKSGLDGLIGGTTKSNSELMIYLGTLGITKEKLSALAKEGKSIDFLLEKMKGLSSAGELLKNTLGGRLTALKNEWDTLMGAGTVDLFQGLKDGIKSFTDHLKMNKEEWVVEVRTFVLDVKDMGRSIGELFTTIKTNFDGLMDFAGVNTGVLNLRDGFLWLTDAIKENKEVVSKVVLAYGAFRVGGMILGGVSALIGLVGRLTGVTWLLNSAMVATRVSLGFMLVGGGLAAGVSNITTAIGTMRLALAMNITTLGVLGGAWATFQSTALASLASVRAGVLALLTPINAVMTALGAMALAVNANMAKANKLSGRVYGQSANELEDKIKALTALQNDPSALKVSKYNESSLQKVLDRTVNQYVKLKNGADEATSATIKFKKVLGTTSDIPKGAFTNIGDDRLSYQTAKRKAELEALTKEQADFETLVAKKVKRQEDATTVKKAKGLANKQAGWANSLHDNYMKSTMDEFDYKDYRAKKAYDLAMSRGLSEHQANTIYQNELAKSEQGRYNEAKKARDEANKPIKWGKSTQSKANKAIEQAKYLGKKTCKDGNCGSQGDFIDKNTANKYAKQSGKTVADSFKDGLKGSKSKKTYESVGSQIAGAFSSVISNTFKQFADSNGDKPLRDIARENFDSQLSGIASAYLDSITSGYGSTVLDAFNAMNTETRNDFQRMDVNIDADNTGIADSITRLEGVMTPELSYTRKMLTQLESMNSKFGSIASSLTVGVDFNGADFNKENIKSGDIFNNGQLRSYESGGVKGGLSGFIGGLKDSIFGTTIRELESTGIGFGEQTADSFLNGIVNGYEYKTEKVTKKKLFGLVKSVGFKTTKEDMDAQVEQNFTDAMNDGYDLIASAMERVGAKNQGLDGIVFKEKVINAKDMSEEEYQKAVTGLMTARLDTLTKGMWVDIGEYQIAGEKSFETGIRVATGVDQATYALEKLGIETVKYDEVLNKTAVNFGGEMAKISLLYEEGMKDVTKTITKSFFGLNLSFDVKEIDKSGLSGIGKYIEGLNGTTKAVIDTYTALKDFEFGMKFFNTNFVEFNESMIDGAGSLERLTAGQASYFENFYTAQERSTIELAKMNKQFDFMGLAMPKSKDGFRDLVESIDTTTDSGGKLYGALLDMSGSFSEVMEAEKALTKERLDGLNKIRDAYFANNAIDVTDKQTYSKALFENYMKKGDKDNSLKYGKQLSDYINQTGYGLDTQRESTLVNDRLSLKYGDKVTTQEVSDVKTQEKIDVLITKIEALEHRLEINDRNLADRTG